MRNVLAVAWASLDSDDLDPRRLRGSIALAEDTYRDVLSSLDEVRALVRHGTTDCRAIDAEQEEIARARAEGREPPYPVALMTRVLEKEEEERRRAKEPSDAA